MKDVKYQKHISEFVPVNQNIVLLVPIVEEKTQAGIIKDKKTIEEEIKGREHVFEVVSISPDITINVKPGDFVMSSSIKEIPFESGREGYQVAITKDVSVAGIVYGK
jgi:co-chaperonin GroES (HSP10)